MNGLLDYIFGSVYVFLERKDAERVLNILHENLIRIRKFGKNEEGEFYFRIRLSSRDKVAALLDKSGIKDYSIKGEGFPFLLNKYKKRYGLLAGLLIFVFLLVLSGSVVWEIDFKGNENVPDSVVERQLRDVGFGVGTFIPKIDFYTLSNEFLMQSDDFSFISVNMEGTKANVELRERKKKDEKEGYEASNLVARYSGKIESMTVYSGQTVVEQNSTVQAGDLLVSGFVEKTTGFDIVRSTGCIYAFITREFKIEVPYEKKVKEYTGAVQKNVDVSFFGKNYNVYSSVDGNFKKFDTDDNFERVVLFDKIRLPLTYTEKTLYEYKEITKEIDKEQAKVQAGVQLNGVLKTELAECEILEKQTKEIYEDDKYVLVCTVSCLADIAQEKEIKLKTEG